MTRNFDNYTAAAEFAAMMAERYEVQIEKTNFGYMVICIR